MYFKKKYGILGEDIAANYLQGLEYKIIVRNFRCRSGEIDIIAKDKDEWVFFEVKTRNNFNCGKPAEAINSIKMKHIYRTAEYFLYKNNIVDCFVRFDVIEVFLENNKYKVRHLKNVELKI